MCEFKVMKKDKIVFQDAVYAKLEGETVTVKNILGSTKKFDDCRIVEVDVNNTRLVLS